MTVKAAGLAAQFFEELSGEFETLGESRARMDW